MGVKSKFLLFFRIIYILTFYKFKTNSSNFHGGVTVNLYGLLLIHIKLVLFSELDGYFTKSLI